MHFFLLTVLYALTINALLAFVIAFYWQFIVILSIHAASDHTNAHAPWKALADENSPQVTFGRFIAGEVFPELRPKWIKAITYVIYSFLALFIYVITVTTLWPDALN